MNKIRNIILATAIVLLSCMVFAEEPAKKPDEPKDPIIGHAAQQDYLDELREKQTEKSTMWYKVFGAAACVGILSVGGLMVYLRHKEKK
jgi:hypothetical protein